MTRGWNITYTSGRTEIVAADTCHTHNGWVVFERHGREALRCPLSSIERMVAIR